MKTYYKVLIVLGVAVLGGLGWGRYYNNVKYIKGGDIAVQSQVKHKSGNIQALEIEENKDTQKEKPQEIPNNESSIVEQEEKQEPITKREKNTAQSRGMKEAVAGYSALASSPTITLVQDSTYLTNKSSGVLLKINYSGSGDKKLKVGSSAQQVVGTATPYQYVCQVADNTTITATDGGGTGTYTVSNMVDVRTGCKLGTGTGYVQNKTYYSATLGGQIVGASGKSLSSSNIRELGVKYWRADMEDEIYTVKASTIPSGTGSISYNVTARSLKENTTYYMQSYMINTAGEVLLGDIKEFSTLGQGIGLYGLYYSGNSDTKPKRIKQETADKMTIAVPTGYSKAKWVGEVSPLNNGLMTFKVTSVGTVSIKIGNETLSFASGGGTKTTSNIYTIGEKYPITIEAKAVGGSTVKVEWLEDNGYQEIHKEQLYPKEYVKLESAVINSKGTDNQQVNKTTGKVMKKKVITNGQNITKFELTYNNTTNTATNAKINGTTSYTLTGSSPQGELIGWIIYNANGIVEPLTENVKTIDYSTNKVTLRNGSVWTLYNDVEIVGRLMQLSDRKVYDLGRYLTSSSGSLSDGKTLGTSDVYRVDNVDTTHVLNLYPRESQEYQKALEKYGTMERFVEDAKSVDNWNLGIGEARLNSIVPLRILLSFDGDGNFTMSNPVVKINKDLFTTKALTQKDTVFKLTLPTNEKTSDNKLTSLYYSDWRYMNNLQGSYYTEAASVANANGTANSTYGGTATIEEDGDYFKITLNNYSALNKVSSNQAKNNIMLNVLLRVDSIQKKTSKEVFDGISAAEKTRTGYNLNGAYRTYTNVQLVDAGSIETVITQIPVEMKIKPQVNFE